MPPRCRFYWTSIGTKLFPGAFPLFSHPDNTICFGTSKVFLFSAISLQIVEGIAVCVRTFGDKFPVADPQGAIVLVMEIQVIPLNCNIARECRIKAAAG